MSVEAKRVNMNFFKARKNANYFYEVMTKQREQSLYSRGGPPDRIPLIVSVLSSIVVVPSVVLLTLRYTFSYRAFIV